MQRLIGLLIFLAAGIGAYFCVTNVLWQHRANRTFVPVAAQILDTEIKSHKGDKSTTYSPEATYAYTYNGQSYTSSRVLAITYSTNDFAWARGVLSRIDGNGAVEKPEGGWQSTAYVDPTHPQDAILVRDYSFLPYGFGMATLVAAGVGLGLLTGVMGVGRKKMEAVALDDSGWRLLLPQVQLRTQWRNAWIRCAGLSAAVLVMPVHWVWVARQTGLAAYISWAMAGAVVVGLAVLAFRRWSVCHHISDARLRIRPAPAQRGAAVALQVGLDAYVPLRVTRITAKFVCLQHYKETRGSKTTWGSRQFAERPVELSRVEVVAAGEEVDGSGEITLEMTLPATTDRTVQTGYPYYVWSIHVKVELEGMVDYMAVFPVEVS